MSSSTDSLTGRQEANRALFGFQLVHLADYWKAKASKACKSRDIINTWLILTNTHRQYFLLPSFCHFGILLNLILLSSHLVLLSSLTATFVLFI